MRITFVLSHLKINGGNRASLTYANLLSLKGHQVTVTALTHGWRRFFKNTLGIKVLWIPNFQPKIKWVKNFDEEHVPDGDIIIATAWQTAGPVASYAQSKGKKFYFIQHYESLYHGEKEKVDHTYYLPLHKIVISTWLKHIMKSKFNIDSNLIVTPVDTKFFQPIGGLRSKKEIKILMLHHQSKWKGVDIGVEVFNRLKEKYPNIKLIMFGVRQKEKPKECDEYYFNPDQRDLVKLYSSCDIYLCPSEHEGLGMPGMEAMACKCALVTFDTGGSRDYAIDGQTAFVAEHNNVDDLADKLELAIENTELRTSIAENGYQFIVGQFLWERAVDEVESLFGKAIKI